MALLAALLLVGTNVTAFAQARQASPEGASGSRGKSLATAQRFMVAAANPLAVDAGLQILKAGGSAVDSAIATQLVLALVEPQSSGLGGGAFLVAWDARAKSLRTYDGRETAPATAKPDRFFIGGRQLKHDEAIGSGLSVGVPGLVRLLEHAHRQHGRLPWARLFAPAIQLARDGFPVSPRLWLLLHYQGANRFSAGARRYFFDDRDDARASGYRLANPDFVATLEAIAARGGDAFYAGPIADAIVQAVAEAKPYNGDVSAADLAVYQVRERPPLCLDYRSHRICGMGPPSSGMTTVGQALKLIEPFRQVQGPNAAMSGSALHLMTEGLKLAFADRNQYVADPEFVSVPSLLDRSYIDERRRLIDPLIPIAKPTPGNPPGLKQARGDDATEESVGTTQISIVDADGNAVSMTSTIESGFGSRLWAAGFLLNNELTDFSFRYRDGQGRAIANRVEAGKRPRSSMAPTIIFDEKGEVFAVLGSPGGSRIIPYVLKAIVALIDWQLDAQAATALPNFALGDKSVVAELTPAGLYASLRLKPFGHAFTPDLMTSGLHIIVRRNGRLEGGADPRREGVAAGE